MKKKLLQALGYLGIAVLIVAIPIAWASIVKDSMTFEGPLTIKAAITHTGNNTQTGNLTLTGDITQVGALGLTGDITQTGSQAVTGNVVVESGYFRPAVYSHASTSGALTWSTAYGNVLILSGTTPTAIALPAITAAMSGYTFTVKNESGATTRTLTPNAGVTDYIEATQGTMTGTSDASMDAAGDVAVWMAVHSGDLAGSYSVWMIVSDKIQ